MRTAANQFARTSIARHTVIDGDFMEQVHQVAIGEADLTACVGESRHPRVPAARVHEHDERALRDGWQFRRAMGTDGRALGSELERELANSARKARLLDDRAPVDTIRVVTDGRSVVDIAEDALAAAGWVNRP